MPDPRKETRVPQGLNLRHTLKGHQGVISRIAWSPDGQVLASGSRDGTVRLWEPDTGRQKQVLKGHSGGVNSVAWSRDLHLLAIGGDEESIWLWDLQEQVFHEVEGNSGGVNCVAWSPDGHFLVSGTFNGYVRLWGNAARDFPRTLERSFNKINSIVWSPTGEQFAVGGWGSHVLLCDIKGEDPWVRHILKGQQGGINSLVWLPDGETLAGGSIDETIRLWNTKTAQLTLTLEGHTASVNSVDVSFDGEILSSKSLDGTVRLWRIKTGECVAVLDEPPSGYWLPSLAFHPKEPVLATLGEEDSVIRIWDLNFADIVGTSSFARDVSYTNAKVVLVGESGVGKTGLGVRLAEGVWRPTPGSTHGMNVWPLHSELGRDVMLWDFAGQDEYRLIHQLFMNETNVALLLYDPTRSNDTFFGIDYWEKALKNAVSDEVKKILVAARVDVGGVRMTSPEIEAYCNTRGYLAHFATSAETNEGCDQLRAAIMAAIPWKQLPRTSSPEVFKRIKEFLTSVRQGSRILVREADLRAEFEATPLAENLPTEDEFGTVIGHVETTGLIKRLSFGDFVLLKKELLNGYASNIIDAARRHPDGLGAVRKAEVLDGRIQLTEVGELRQSDKIFLLHATVELFLRLGLALEQDGNLVFPSKFNRRMPPLDEDPVIQVEFSFEGPVENLYTTLVVKLYYGGIFRLKKLWRNAAEYVNARDRVCGFQLHSEGDGRGMLKVFYADGISDGDKALFLKIVADHFTEKDVVVERRRIYRCPGCREVVRDRDAPRRATQGNRNRIFCQICGTPIHLIDALEVLYRDNEKFLAQITAMENRAEASMERGGEMVSAAAELRTENFKTWAGGANVATIAIVFTDIVGGTKLNVESGDEYWQQVSDAHFKRAQKLVRQGSGYLLKTKGDGVIAAFRDAGTSLDFALALSRDTGSDEIRIRAAINIGPVAVSDGDVFGQQVNMVARIEARAEKGGIWVSAKVKEDIDIRNSARHRQLKWIPHPNEELKGFPGLFTLWSVSED